MYTKTFSETGTFESLYAAQKWLTKNGYSFGASSAMKPIPVLKGDFVIAKWKNLTKSEIAGLDGKLDGNMREGPLTLTLKFADPAQQEPSVTPA